MISVVAEHNWRAIVSGWDLIADNIKTEKDFDTIHVAEVKIQLKTELQPMKLVFKRTYVDRKEAMFVYVLDLYQNNSELRGRAPSGLMILWSFDRDHHRISTTEVRSLPGFSGCGLGSALVKLADKIIVSKLIPLTELDLKYQHLPIIGSIEDCAHDANGKVTRWTTFCAQQLGYSVTGKNDNGWPLLTKKFV